MRRSASSAGKVRRGSGEGSCSGPVLRPVGAEGSIIERCGFVSFNATFVPTVSARPTGQMPAMPAETPRVALKETNPHLSTAAPSARSTGPLQDLSSLPRRTLPAEEALRLVELGGLSRVHRRLLLLIDGRRTTQELVRLMGRSPDDVQKMLHDLAYIRVVQ